MSCCPEYHSWGIGLKSYNQNLGIPMLYQASSKGAHVTQQSMCPFFPLIIIMAQVTPQLSGSVEVTIYLSFKKSELSAFSKALCTNNDLEAMLMIFLVLSPLIYSNVQGRSTNWIFGNNCDCCGLHDSYCFLPIPYCIYDHEVLCGYGNHCPLHSGFRYW